jgi:hypothetical protein
VKLDLTPTICVLSLIAAFCCEAASLTPITLNCDKLKSSALTNSERRIEITAQGFSVLPPQGEGWCYRLTGSQGISFYKVSRYGKVFEPPRSRAAIAVMHTFSAVAMSLKGFRDFGPNIQSPSEMQAAVDLLIREHVFAQILMGVITSEHSFYLVKSDIETDSYSSASCVRFQARIEERGNSQASGLVFILNLAHNIICRHPTGPEIGLIWVGLVERYAQGDQAGVDTLKEEYEPFVQSLQFIPPR